MGGKPPTANQVELFYDEFSRRFIEDIVLKNERVARQLRFWSSAIPRSAQSVLMIGFGSGQGAHFIASEIAQSSVVTAVDISSDNLRIATGLFGHPRVRYQKLDAVNDLIEGTFDAIVLPDVYEHIPVQSRPMLHSTLDRLLDPNGRLFITVPSPGKQDALRTSGQGLQIVDETVTLGNLVKLAGDVGGSLTYFNLISVWQTNDYVHAVVERGADHVRSIGPADRTPIKGWPRRGFWCRGREFAYRRTRLIQLHRAWLRKRLRTRLSKQP